MFAPPSPPASRNSCSPRLFSVSGVYPDQVGALSALKIAPCRRPSKSEMVSYCQLSAVSCQPLFSFSPGAGRAACWTALRKTASSPTTVSLAPGSPLPSISVRARTVQDCANREQINSSISVHYKLPIQQPLFFDTLTNAPGGVPLLPPLCRLLHTQESLQPLSSQPLTSQLADTPGWGSPLATRHSPLSPLQSTLTKKPGRGVSYC